MISLDRSHQSDALSDEAFSALRPRVEAAHRDVIEGTGEQADMLGWRDLLLDPDADLLDEIAALGEEIRGRADVLVCIGIGGSYLGARAVIDALDPYFGNDGTEVIFAGHHLSPAYHRELLDYLDGKRVYVNVISKSGTTLEPMLAFRFIRRWLRDRFDDADRRIIVTTDADKGILNDLKEQFGYRKYIIPDSVGGRFSVLTPVGLVPIAAAGHDIRALFHGAADAAERYADPEGNPALDYAAARYLLHEQGFRAELLAVFEPKLSGFGAWWQQLYGESEGKEHKGLYPDTVQYSTDLHSLGQYVQQGQRVLTETFLLADDEPGLTIPEVDGDPDQLNDLAGKPYRGVNQAAYEGTAKAHRDGGVPNCTIRMSALDAATLGEAIYFFEHAVAVSGYLLDVNPFNQPGVEDYKSEMNSLLGR